MNKVNFNQTGGFPLSTNILEAMQTAYSLFNHLGAMAGDMAIISGCEVIGQSVSDGVVYINGEILEFKGGTIGTNVIIREETESRIFEDGSTKQVIAKRYATFGSSTPDKTFAWSNFKKIFPSVEIASFKKNLEDRIKALEMKKSPIPIGLVAIWGKPASEPIPEGWQEYVPLRGRMPVGQDPNYRIYSNDQINHRLNEIGATGGAESSQLNEEHLPPHRHNTFKLGRGSGWGAGMGQYAVSGVFHGGKDNYNITGTNGEPNGYKTSSVGNSKRFTNMSPYRIIRFIEFVGFN